MIPLTDANGKVWSLQFINPDGSKRFKAGGRINGCYHAIGSLTDILYICEGYATGATIHEATGCGVAIAFNAGNLKPVALALRKKHPEQQFIIAADNDHKTSGNPGLTKGYEAAAVADMKIVFPAFPPESKGTDFNDLASVCGGMES